MSTKKGPPKSMTREENRDATASPYARDTITVTDPLGAAIAATVGERVPSADAMAERAQYVEETASNEARAAAMEAYIKAGVAKCMIAIEGHEIVGAAQFRQAMNAMLRHLHEDHPENYLP